MENTPFLTMFPECLDYSAMCGGLSEAYITRVDVNIDEQTLAVQAHFNKRPAPAEVNLICETIRAVYNMRKVQLIPDYPKPKINVQPKSPESQKGRPEGTVLMGRNIRGSILPMSDLAMDSGAVIVEGDVISVESRKLQKRGAAVLIFDITDLTGSVRVSRYLRNTDDQTILDKIQKGDHLVVQGDITYSRYDEDMILEPRNIMKGKRYIRPDEAPEKRVELHVHTRFSALDALTDPEAIVARAAQWGMPAIAVTDHGVCQAFPDIWKAGKKHKIKVIYGCEIYYVNDMEGNRAVHGNCSLPLDSEFVSFDIETTGLNAVNDRMTEIGAQIFKEGEIIREFNTFVNPGIPIPAEITRLTGIRDEDVKDAPSEKEAMQMFLEFAGDRPLIAHNADFDTGFMHAACRRSGLRFSPVYLDTLALSQALLPDMKRFKLDMVANHLKLPKFNHHRASDDAMVVAQIMAKFLPLLRQQGVRNVDDIEAVYHRLKRTDLARSRHMIVLARNKQGLKNLYELVSQSYLKYFHKTPTVPRSLLIQHREGLLIGSACGMGELYGAVMRGEDWDALEKIAEFYDYLEIQPLVNNGFLVDNAVVQDYHVLEDYNRRIVELGRRMNKPVIAASDVHFLDPEDEQYRHIMQAAKGFSDADRNCPIYFRTTEEMLKEFEYLGEETAKEVVVTNTRAIADMVEEFELLPQGLFPPEIKDSANRLKELVLGKMHSMYGENPPKIVTDRVNQELNTILDHHYDVIYMSAQELVKNSLEHGYLVGSRGSVGSSIVAYMSDITEVNSLPPHYLCPNCQHSEFVTDGSYDCGADMPDKVCPNCGTPMRKEGFNIPFETFLGFPGNEKTPDIDLNFSGEYQGKSHKYTEILFGSDHVFRAGTIGTIAEKTAYGYVLNYLEEREMKVTKAEENRLASGLVGIKRTTSQHPGGLVIIPQDLDVTDFCPVQHPADDKDSDIITTHFEYHCMESNLLKLDELGHDDPTMIRMLEDMTGVDAQKIELGEKETMKIFLSPKVLGLPEDDPIIGKTGTLGIPEFGTGFTRQMLVDTKPTKYNTLIRLSGFSHGTDVWAGNIRDLVVNGIANVDECVGCRDDIMIYLMSKGMSGSLAFKTMEAVRKGKVSRTGQFPGDSEEQMHSLGVPEWYIESCRKIQYLFPKAHAVAYVMMAFRIAWFKVHRPLAYYSAYFYRRSQKDSFDAQIMCSGVDELRRTIMTYKKNPNLSAKEDALLATMESVYEFYMRGFSFAPIDLYESDAYKFLPVGEKQLRPPFVAISGLGSTAAEDLLRCQQQHMEFLSVEELGLACPKVSQTHLEMLKSLGAFGDLPESSQMNLFEM